MNHIKNFLPMFTQVVHHEQNWKLKVISQWQLIMGSMSSKVSIHTIHNNTITLGVTDSCWMQELNLLSEIIKEKINATIGSNKIEVIRFKYITAPKASSIISVKQIVPTQVQEKALSSKERQALARIKDQELSEALQRFLHKCHLFS